MSSRAGSIVVIALVLTAAGCLAAWIEADRRSSRRRALRLFPLPHPNMSSQPFSGSGPGPSSGTARFFASHAAHAGPCLVSYRFIRASDLNGQPMSQGAGFGPNMGPFFLGLQVLNDRQGAMSYKLDLSSLRAVDDTGRTMLHRQSAGDSMWPITGGTIYSQWMESPGPHATGLTLIEGAISVDDHNGLQHTFPFRMENVPLPNTLRIFGQAASIRISDADVYNIPRGFSIIAGEDAEAILDRSIPAKTSPLTSPQRLLLGPDKPVRMNITPEANSHEFSIRADLGSCGSLIVRASSSGLAQTVRVWDGEPFILVAPASAFGSRVASAMRLSRDQWLPDAGVFRAPFLAEPGRPGGAISSEVLVDGRPFGRAQLSLQMWALRDGRWAGPELMRALTDRKGKFVIPNLHPGEYRIVYQIDNLTAYFHQGEAPFTTGAYLLERFGSRAGRWAGVKIENIMVRSGQKCECKPLEWVSASAATEPLLSIKQP